MKFEVERSRASSRKTFGSSLWAAGIAPFKKGIDMILNDGTNWEADHDELAGWAKAYPDIKVDQEIRGMTAWLEANPTKRKTRRGIKRFVNAWLARAQERGGSPLAQKKSRPNSYPTRDMTTLDDLTHDFANVASFREKCLAQYGQYFSHDNKRVTA